MTDIAHYFGEDIGLSAKGDIALSTGTQNTTERVYRRLLTNRRDYEWSPGYGGGLRRMVGQPVRPKRTAAIVRSQMYQEATVQQSPSPTVALSLGSDPTYVYLTVSYTDAAGATTTLPVTLSPSGAAVLGDFVLGSSYLSGV